MIFLFLIHIVNDLVKKKIAFLSHRTAFFWTSIRKRGLLLYHCFFLDIF